MTGLSRRLAVARGDEPADTVVRGGRVLCVFTREWLDADVAIVDGVVAGVGSYTGNQVVEADGRFVVPGFIDSHMHLESVKLLVDEFARLVLPLGTTAVVADPHEIRERARLGRGPLGSSTRRKGSNSRSSSWHPRVFPRHRSSRRGGRSGPATSRR